MVMVHIQVTIQTCLDLWNESEMMMIGKGDIITMEWEVIRLLSVRMVSMVPPFSP